MADIELPNEPEFVSGWVEAWNSASAEEKDWRADGDKAVKAYRGETDSNSKRFNIYHANIETIVPALYNSTPVPDVRRRYNDPDPVGKVVGDILERGLSYAIDAYDFDQTMLSTVRDMSMPGRGLARVRYKPTFAQDGSVAYEQVTCEHVAWRSFRHGPGRAWVDVQWIAFEHFLSKEDIEAKGVKPEVLAEVPFTYSASAKDEKDSKNSTAPATGKRARVLEIWDKLKREVFFICPDYTRARLWSAGDPLELEDFYPIPRPMQAVATTDSLVPICSYTLYEELILELNEVTGRITKLVKQLRPRGIYVGLSQDIKAIVEADDGELVATGAEMFAATGGEIDKAISWFPLDQTVGALKQLIEQREIIKQNIYEVTKIADVMRGASQASETATAQNIKAQWGSLSVQRMQAEVARFARDLFRIKAEVMATKFGMQTLMMMTGINPPTMAIKQAAMQRVQLASQRPPAPGEPPAVTAEDEALAKQPSQEEVEKMLRSDSVRGFRIDIESDSTIRGDLGRNQQQMTLFLSGTAQFIQAVGPMVQADRSVLGPMLEIYNAFARQFKLGKQAEDALDRLADQARKSAEGPPEPPKPDPNVIKAQVAQKLGEQKLQQAQQLGQIKEHGAMMDNQLDQAKHAREMEALQAETQADLIKHAIAPQPIVGQAMSPYPPQRGF